MTIEFKATGEFAALNNAQKYCKDKGYSAGSMCAPLPIALVKAEGVLVAKWRNLTSKERALCDGTITAENFRTGPVTVKLFRE